MNAAGGLKSLSFDVIWGFDTWGLIEELRYVRKP